VRARIDLFLLGLLLVLLLVHFDPRTHEHVRFVHIGLVPVVYIHSH